MRLGPIQDVEKGLQLRSRFARSLHVPKKVRLGSSLAAALLEGLFEHPEERSIAFADRVYEQPLVAPQFTHFRQVPLRTMLNCLHSGQGSPS